MSAAPDFTLGVEEEYLLVDLDSLRLATAPQAMMDALSAELDTRVSPEFLQCQVEIGTGVCRTIGQAREELRGLRAAVAKVAKAHNLAPIAASCHPSADWKEQHHTDKERYNALSRQLRGVARRMLICGMHVHVGLNDDALRNDLMPQMSYFLPHLLAMSCSSPFWQGDDTGLASYRLTVFDNLPRTGLPPHFPSWAEYERTVKILVDLSEIEDATKIWWDLRPSHRFPTLETRICDVAPRLEHTLSLAALIQALMRMLWRLKTRNQRWRAYDAFLIAENRWRAQRYGVSEGLIDFGRGQVLPFDQLLEEMLELVEEDGAALESMAELEGLRDLLAIGVSSERQRAAFAAAQAAGADREAALGAVTRHLIEEFHADL